MPKVGSSVVLREIAAQPRAGFPQRNRFRREAIDLIEQEALLDPAYSYRIVPLDESPRDLLRVGGEVLDAIRLVPESGVLTAIAAAVCTLIETCLCRARHNAVYADPRTMPSGLVFPGIHSNRHMIGSA